MSTTLYVFSGLPGVGKTTLSQRLARSLGALHLRIDTIEQGLRDLCGIDVQGEGYAIACRLAADNLRLGVSVVADSCNPIELTRNEWERIGREVEARCINIEVICSDATEHRRRVETRRSNISGLILPTWADVQRREYEAWTKERLVVDTSAAREEECFEQLLAAIRG